MNQRTKRSSLAALGVFVILTLVLGAFLFSREEGSRFSDPSGQFTVVVSKRRYQDYLMRFPGQSGDEPGFIEIFDRSGNSFGRIPVEMINAVSDLHWPSSHTGARIPLIAEWDFQHHTCFYWSADQTRQIWVKR